MIPLTFVLVVALLYLSMRGWPQTFLVLSSLPFAVAGSVRLLAFMGHNLSTAVWVGLIAVTGVAAETGIVMLVYLDKAFERYMREGRIHTPADVDGAVVEGAAARVRPLIMTVATTVLSLLPLLWEAGAGADVSARTAAPVVVGGSGSGFSRARFFLKPEARILCSPLHARNEHEGRAVTGQRNE